MQDAFVNALIEVLPIIVKLVFTVIGIIVTNKIVPYIVEKTKANKVLTTKEQLEIVKQWTQVFVDSAQRLDKSGKLAELTNLTKKEYVMKKLMDKIGELGYKFTEDQLDQIRRAAVYALDQAEALFDQTKQNIEEAANEQD